ncbi:hypothetical protein LPW11_06145 [Geomonas sp. RF6]|uniref:hypothetical protein n=1 Tax=Geomonas sp. RF6 TaxID=2897342 RepID=UPI001E41AAA7|nr:hypothetical protein [Geomonas sp. RF6]UFS71770.1 hypothetical protein LPW11_06145 [Geomonas sp. RF6]
MIVDLFSHKIHSSSDSWVEKLAELAAIFGEFDGQLYDRPAIEVRLQAISPRVSYLASEAATRPLTPGGRLDVSKFRDEISAYPAYLGLYFLEQSPAGWVLRLSETAKRYLLREEPDVASFLRLQLPLFQYPNAMGARYRSFTNDLHIQSNTRDRTLEFIAGGIHFSPVRLIAVALKADALLRGVNIFDASISFHEIFGLANAPDVNRYALPPQEVVAATLAAVRRGEIVGPATFESRFHTLRHTEIFQLSHGAAKLREGVTVEDRNQLVQQLDAICSIAAQFEGFDDCTTGQDLEQVIASGDWGRYFDGVRVLPSNVVLTLTADHALNAAEVEPQVAAEQIAIQPVPETYPFRQRTGTPPPARSFDRRREIADPEVTRVKLQRRNLAHKELIDKMDSYLRSLGAIPKENDHIDLLAKIPHDGSFIFEMKSGGDTLLDQIRKGLSQLYEYRFRYRDLIEDEAISLCLVLPGNPSVIPWITRYLCEDRDVGICWFNEDGHPVWPDLCEDRMSVLRPPVPA